MIGKKIKPKIELEELKDVCVYTPTKENYIELMRIYESANWRWAGFEFPTKDLGIWDHYKEETIITAYQEWEQAKGFTYSDKSSLEKIRTILSTNEFYKKQGISQEKLEEVNKYFDELNIEYQRKERLTVGKELLHKMFEETKNAFEQRKEQYNKKQK